MRRRAPCQTWTLSRIHRLLRPLRTKVAALSSSLKREQKSRLLVAPTPTPTRPAPPVLRRTYQTRKRKRGDPFGSDDYEQYAPRRNRTKPKHRSSDKPERKWSQDVLERVGAVVDAFRVLADVVYDEQAETEGIGGSCVLSLRDMCVRLVAEDIEPFAVAAAGEASDSDDDGELVDITKLVDRRLEEIPEHLRRAAIIPYALAMIKQHIDTISPLPQLWNHILAICLSSSASSSAANMADVLQICSNLLFATLRQPRSNSRSLASVYRNIVGPDPDKIPPELFCKTILEGLTVGSVSELEQDYLLPPNYLAELTPTTHRSPMKTPARATRSRTVPPTPDPVSLSANNPTLFPIHAFLSRPIAYLVAELSPTCLLSFIESAAFALVHWIDADASLRSNSRLREHRADAPRTTNTWSLAPRICARIGDWVSMVLASDDLDALRRASCALGQVVQARAGRVDVSDSFCALACASIVLSGPDSELATYLRLVPLAARTCQILANTLPEDGFIRRLEDCTRALAQAGCPHLEATLLQLVLNERVDGRVEEMLEDAEARWGPARSDYRWDEITNTWAKQSFVERKKDVVTLSSDTESDGEDPFAIIPEVIEAAVPRRRTRRSSPITRSDDESDTTARPRPRRASFLVVDSDEAGSEEYDPETGTDSDVESNSDSDSSDFDWSQYNGRYHPHDRVLTQPLPPPPKPTPKLFRIIPRPARVIPKRPRMVVELPLPKRPKRRVLGENNLSRDCVTTSTLSRLCRQFSTMSSEDENENELPQIEMPSSDDMDLFQVVTPVARRVRPIRRSI